MIHLQIIGNLMLSFLKLVVSFSRSTSVHVDHVLLRCIHLRIVNACCIRLRIPFEANDCANFYFVHDIITLPTLAFSLRPVC